MGRKNIIKKYNEQFNETLGTINGFEDIFDKKSGAIMFEDWEWHLIDNNNALKRLFDEK